MMLSTSEDVRTTGAELSTAEADRLSSQDGNATASTAVTHAVQPSRWWRQQQQQQQQRALQRPRRHVVPYKYKTTLCDNFMRQGTCRYTIKCMYAHGDHELRTVEMNVQDGLMNETAVRLFYEAHREQLAATLGLDDIYTRHRGGRRAHGNSSRQRSSGSSDGYYCGYEHDDGYTDYYSYGYDGARCEVVGGNDGVADSGHATRVEHVSDAPAQAHMRTLAAMYQRAIAACYDAPWCYRHDPYAYAVLCTTTCSHSTSDGGGGGSESNGVSGVYADATDEMRVTAKAERERGRRLAYDAWCDTYMRDSDVDEDDSRRSGRGSCDGGDDAHDATTVATTAHAPSPSPPSLTCRVTTETATSNGSDAAQALLCDTAATPTRV